MTKSVVFCLLLFGLLAIQTVGHMNSDPAPGRSPGPPAHGHDGTVIAATATAITTAVVSVATATQPTADAIKRSYVPPEERDDIGGRPLSVGAVAAKRSAAMTNGAADKWQSETAATTITAAAAAAAAATLATSASTTTTTTKTTTTAATVTTAATTQTARGARTTTKPTTTNRRTLKSCNEGLNEFLNDVVVIDDLDEPSTDATNGSQTSQSFEEATDETATASGELPPYRLRMQLRLEHDVFDATTANGISCGLMYKVRLMTNMPSTTTTGDVGATGAPYSGEFFVESLSTRDGRDRGSFVSHRLGNKLPISWFSALHRHGKDDGSAGGFGGAADDGAATLNWLSNMGGGGGGGSSGDRPGDDGGGDGDDVESASSDADATKSDFNDFNSATLSGEDNFADGVDSLKHGFHHQQQQQQQDAQEAAFSKRWWLHSDTAAAAARQHRREKAAANGQRHAATGGKYCPDNKWYGSTKSHANASGAGDGRTESLNLWMVNELCEQDDTVEFRVFFRATTRAGGANMETANGADGVGAGEGGGDANSEAQHVVYRKTFKFHVRKDCQLVLRAATSGTLDYTLLPLYVNDCTVHLPSYRHLESAAGGPTATNSTASTGFGFDTDTDSDSDGVSSATVGGAASMPPVGILVELQRLNVPCNSGGYVRFNERSALCGKLEELQAADRAYHFDVRQRTSIRLHRNPMFSLSYKLVDYCYNVTTSNQTGEFFIRPSVRDSLECYFRIHLPYGNRVLLRLVTNNDSDVLPMTLERGAGSGVELFSNGADDREPLTIYTSSGAAIETRLVNLTLSGGSSSVYATPLRRRMSTVGDAAANEVRDAYPANMLDAPSPTATANCAGIVIKVFENDYAKWSYCVDGMLQMRAFVLISSGNTLSVHLYRTTRGFTLNPATMGTTTQSLPTIYLSYQARPELAIVSNCAFGWIAMQQFCISAIETSLSWHDAEQHCANEGGHLASIRNDDHQQVVNQMLLHSPGYLDENAYWVGASDNSYEGDFRWSDGMLFQYTNWFPGWSQHGHYNKQPNDDGLSSQDCIELRRFFRTPPGIQSHRSPLTSSFMWNDRDCSAKNFLICERAMSDESLRRGWINDCNKTVSLTKEHPRASLWSPSFPRQYPDNANCFTTITAPTGYRIVIEFEELVIENEPGCTYDYLEITEPTSHYGDAAKYSKSSKHKNPNNTNNNNSNINSNNNNNNNNNNNKSGNNGNSNRSKTFRKRSSYENPSLSSTTTSTSNTNANTYTNAYNSNLNDNVNTNDNYLYSSNSYNNYNLAQSNYQKLLHIFSNLYKPHTKFLIQTPDYPKGNPYSHTNHLRGPGPGPGGSGGDGATGGSGGGGGGGGGGADETLPKRLCGDWSSKLKLLRHVSAGSYLGMHFVSDYSHHFGGYKAKTYMENTASECANERLKAYNGSCYLFISYPEVDWWTAQQVCRGMGAKLSSVSSADEHRFITSNIRNQIDYSPQLIYWLGAELEKSGQFEWTDDTKMSFQGWLPGQGQFDVMPADAICLGLQWKMSPTPMLPSGLYWQSQKCNKIGGYVCKKPKESFGTFAFSNFTITGSEGRLVSPAHPNTYPLNLDYWIHIKSPERTRIVVQFQKIDLEPQDECLYDFVSIQNYELVSRITLEPGTNLLPMAMLTSEEALDDDAASESASNAGAVAYNGHLHRRLARSVAALYGNSNCNGNANCSDNGNDKAVTDKKQATSASTAGRRKRKRNTEKSADLMAPFGMQTGHNNIGDSANGSSSDDRQLPPNIAGRRAVRRRRRHATDGVEHGRDASERNENPKHRRRKNAKTSQLHNINYQRRQRWPLRRRRRSTVTSLGERGPPKAAAPSVDNAQSFLPYVRWCGQHDTNMSKFDFVSGGNEVVLNFHSDYSVTGMGFAATWRAIDVSGCPLRTLTSREGNVFSPNYPHFLLNNLNCAYVIQAPLGRRVWLEVVEFNLRADAMLEVDIGSGLFRPFIGRDHLNEGIFVSQREQLRVQFRSGQHPRGRGFQAAYRTVGPLERRERIINLASNITGQLFQLNYPHDMPENVDFTQHLVAPFGDNILLELYGVEFSENGCLHGNLLEIYDNYADNNGTRWQLCKYQQNTVSMKGDGSDADAGGTESNPYGYRRTAASYQQYVAPPVYITSYLNTLHIRQRTSAPSDANLNATVRIQWDNNYKMKLATGDKTVESCQPNPCQFNGKCVPNNGSAYCQCQGHYTGRFCGLNVCELEPCVFGKCELTATSFKCQCQPGYMGTTCEQKQRPCADNPCEGRGMCFEKNGGFFCRCHAWWEGHRCERRMLHIPYKPLSERMLQEPFWLGLITVFVVLAVIGLVWCAKRHFPEKIEKLLAEEADRNRPPGSIHGHHHHTSLREQLQFTTAIPQTAGGVGVGIGGGIAPGAPRSIFNRLGIRKPSLLSLSSPNPISGGGGAAARTFSLDDLLRPPPRRSPSPRKKRNNSTPVKKNAAEKKQILQQLVSPALAVQAKPKVSLGELITMSENRLRAAGSTIDSESDLKETTFSENSGSASGSVARVIADPKLEKKVTFARLLNKVSAEMSSGSEFDMGHSMAGTRNSSALSLPTDIQFRASSMPPSPCTNDIRSPHSTSSNQGSDSLSSSDLALTDFGLRSMQTSGSELGGPSSSAHHRGLPLGLPPPQQRCRIGSAARPKVSSADSILAMFRNFASTATASNGSSSNHHHHHHNNNNKSNSYTTTALIQSNTSVFVSPPTTPTVSSPQDDAPGDDESSTSSMHTPVSFSSGPPDSPVFYRQTTIEVPVLDVLNAHKLSSPSSSTSSSSANLLHPPTILLEIPSNGINKCLSPIREMPTPIPSPALTPIMPRPQRSNSPIFQEDPLSGGDYSEDELKSDHSDRNDNQLSEKLLRLQRDKARCRDTDVDTTPTDTTTTSTAEINRQRVSGHLPLKRLTTPAADSSTRATLAPPPLITIDVEPPTPEERTPRTPRPRDLIIPTLTVEQPSPTKNRHPMIIFPGSPPPQRASIGETSFMFPNKQQQKRLLKQFEKPTSLDFPFAPPMITITSNLSEMESDTEPLSPLPKLASGAGGGLMPPNPVGMCYLSPFTMCSRSDRTISESNLSSSGYSSMASPGPSRCGSSNPLCPNEMDEPGSGHSGAGLSLHVSLMNRRRSSTLASCKENITNGNGSGAGSGAASGSSTDGAHNQRHRSDSETFSDDILLESNDEGIGTDHVDEKLDDSRLSSARFKELDVFMEEHVLIEVDEPAPIVAAAAGAGPGTTTAAPTAASAASAPSTNQQMAQLQLPSIVIQIDGAEKGLSPVSSRSESPLSERAGIGRFSPHFYGRKDQLPFTDSDGLYDFPSSDGKGTSAQSYTPQRRSSSKKRERKSSKCSATQSPTKQQLDVPSKESLNTSTPGTGSQHVCNKHCHSHHHPCPAATVTTRKSPKRRLVNRLPIASSSSSSESLVSAKELTVRPLPRRLNSPNREKRPRKQESLSEEEVADALLRRISPSIVKEEEPPKPKCKINRLRAIGNQIRFLRRLKKSIKTRERLASPSDSCPEENTDDMDSPQATSPLLQPPSPSKTRLALCRQKRLPADTYGITAAEMNTSNWKGMDRSLIGDDLNSD